MGWGLLLTTQVPLEASWSVADSTYTFTNCRTVQPACLPYPFQGKDLPSLLQNPSPTVAGKQTKLLVENFEHMEGKNNNLRSYLQG